MADEALRWWQHWQERALRAEQENGELRRLLDEAERGGDE